MMDAHNNLYLAAEQALLENDPARKVSAVNLLADSWSQHTLHRDTCAAARSLPVPGRPEQPKLVKPMEVPRRKLTSPQGLRHFVHAIAHIEFNAINLALDAVYRFRDMPDDFVTDWLKVAREEALHFGLLQDYLHKAGSHYGEYPAHNGLWEMAVKTDHDVMIRMALVPRVLEARGLDVTPGMITQLKSLGNDSLVAILEVIFRDEIGHVKIGSHWFRYCCEQRGLNTVTTFFDLLQSYMGRQMAGPLAMEARKEAGFSDDELVKLAQLAQN